MFTFRKKREKGHEYNLTYDNLAVPEIHTHEPEDAADEDEKKPIPPASDIKSIKTDFAVSYVLADTDEWRRQFDNRAVKKNCTVPAWLNYKAEKAGVNFSQVLQDALKKILGVTEKTTAGIA